MKAGAVVGDTADFIENLINQFFTHGVVSSSIVVGGILFPSDHLFRMEQAAVCPSADLVDDVGFEIAVDCSRNIFAVAYIQSSVMTLLEG